MRKLALVVASLLSLSLRPGLAHGEGGAPQALEYLGERASRMTAALPAMPSEIAAWERRRETVRGDLGAVLGLPRREAMRGAVLASREDGDVVVEEVAYLWSERAYVSGNVVRPRGRSGRLPGIVVPPGWVGRLDQAYYKNFVYHMARLGCVVLFIDDPRVGKRQAPYAGLYAAASAAGTQVMGVQVFDTLRGLDYLLTRGDVDPGRIGVAGLCQGSEQTWLAAALEERFQFAVPVCGTTTYEGWARMPFFESVALSDPSPYVGNVLRYTDWHEINACIAPRPVLIASNSGDNWWPVEGHKKVVRTLEGVFAMYGAPDLFRHIFDLRSHDMTPYIPDIAPWIAKRVEGLSPSEAPPLPCGEPVDPDFSMLRYMQRRMERQAATFPQRFPSKTAWEACRKDIVEWLREACGLDTVHAAGAGEHREGPSERRGGIVRRRLDLSVDGDYACPATLVCAEEAQGTVRRPAVILSHGNQGHMRSPDMDRAAVELARRGCWVLAPEHASLHPDSLRRAESNGFVSLYGVGDTVGLPPLALRVLDDLAAYRFLAARPEVEKGRIAIAGVDIGAVDAALAAALEPGLAGVACLGATTARDWALEAAPGILLFDHIMPYLPSIVTRTDLEYFYAAVAPRPLLLVRFGDRARWPDSGFDRVKALAGSVYEVLGAGGAFLAMEPADLGDRGRRGAEDASVLGELIAAAAALLPPPPEPGVVGSSSPDTRGFYARHGVRKAPPSIRFASSSPANRSISGSHFSLLPRRIDMSPRKQSEVER